MLIYNVLNTEKTGLVDDEYLKFEIPIDSFSLTTTIL